MRFLAVEGTEESMDELTHVFTYDELLLFAGH
jgi:hypothetical protein